MHLSAVIGTMQHHFDYYHSLFYQRWSKIRITFSMCFLPALSFFLYENFSDAQMWIAHKAVAQ